MSGRRAGESRTQESALRQTYVWRFEDSEREVLVRFGELLVELGLEADRVAPEGVGVISGEVGAVGADLGYLVRALRAASLHLERSEVTEEEAELCVRAGEWAQALERIAGEIGRAVGGGEACGAREGRGAECARAEASIRR